MSDNSSTSLHRPQNFAKLEKAPREWLHQARNWSKADVWRSEWPLGSGNYVVVKDMRPRPLWFRLTIGRYYLKREGKALKAMTGLAGIPRFLGLPDPDCLVMEWKPGKPVFDFKKGEVPTEAISNLEKVMKSVHDIGVTHGDLHRENVLVADDHSVSLIDWATASVFGRNCKRWTVKEWISLDNRGVAKIKFRHTPQLLTPEEQDLLVNGSPLYSTIRNFGHLFRRVRGAKVRRNPAESAKHYGEVLEQEGLLAETEKSNP